MLTYFLWTNNAHFSLQNGPLPFTRLNFHSMKELSVDRGRRGLEGEALYPGRQSFIHLAR